MTELKLPQERIESQRSDAATDPVEVAIIKLLVDVGFHHKRIAALFDMNQGRISEVANGQVRPDVGYAFEVIGGADNE